MLSIMQQTVFIKFKKLNKKLIKIKTFYFVNLITICKVYFKDKFISLNEIKVIQTHRQETNKQPNSNVNGLIKHIEYDDVLEQK